MKYPKTYLAGVAFLLSPLLSIPILLSEIWNGNRRCFILVSFLMALCAIISPPFADLYQHALMYQMYQNSASTSFIQYGGSSDFILYTISAFFAKNGIPFDLIRGIFVFICYQISFELYKALIDEKPDLCANHKLSFYIFLCFFFSVPFIWIVNGLRSATSGYLMIFAWLQLYKGKTFKTIVFSLLSIWTHFFSWIFVPFLFFYWFKKITLTQKQFQYLSIVLLIGGVSVFNFFLNSLSLDTLGGMGVSEYSKSYYTEDLNYSTRSLNGNIALVLERFPIICMVLYAFLKRETWKKRNEQTFFYVLLLLLFAVSFFFIPLQRLSWLVCPIMIFLFLKNSTEWVLRRRVKVIMYATILSQLAYMYGYREPLLHTPFWYLMAPAWFSLTHTYPLTFFLDV